MKKKLIAVLIVITILIIMYTISIFIPKKQTYDFTAELTLKYTDYAPENVRTSPIFGDYVKLIIHFNKVSIYNTYYDKGYVIINGQKYSVENSRFYPRSFIGKFRHELKYVTEMIKYKYDVFWFDIEHESGYTVTVSGLENSSNIHLLIKNDGVICYSYEK